MINKFIGRTADQKRLYAFCVMEIKDCLDFRFGASQQDLYFCITFVQINGQN
jgi:hypothetical protein